MRNLNIVNILSAQKYIQEIRCFKKISLKLIINAIKKIQN